MFFTEKQYDQALTLLENVFSREPDNLDARLLQSDSWLAKQETKKAIDVLEALDRAYPGAPAIKFQLARAYLQGNEPVKAATLLRDAVAAKPDYADAILLLAEINLRNGQPGQVVTGLEELLKKRPDLGRRRFFWARLPGTGRLEDAAAILLKQIDQSPARAEPYVILGLIQRQQKKTEEARRSLDKALEVAPDNLEAVNQLVEMDLEAKDLDGAMRRVQRQIAMSSKDAVSYLLEGKVQTAEKEWPAAEAALKKAIELNPEFGAGL